MLSLLQAPARIKSSLHGAGGELVSFFSAECAHAVPAEIDLEQVRSTNLDVRPDAQVEAFKLQPARRVRRQPESRYVLDIPYKFCSPHFRTMFCEGK